MNIILLTVIIWTSMMTGVSIALQAWVEVWFFGAHIIIFSASLCYMFHLKNEIIKESRDLIDKYGKIMFK